MSVLRFVAHFGRAKVKSLLWFGAIGDNNHRFLICRNRRIKRHHNFFARILVAGDFGRRCQRRNRKIDRIELQLRQSFGDRLESNRRFGRNRALFEIRRHIQRQMQDVHQAARRIFQRAGIRWNRPSDQVLATD